MRKITLLFLFILASTFGFSQNLISNGTFDDATGWTFLDINTAGLNIGSLSIAGGVATFSEVTNPEWVHVGVYTSVNLDPGTYQFDMDVSYDGVSDSWGEVFVGATVPVQNTDYTDNKILTVHHTWSCGATTYSGLATETGCDGNPDAGKFTISTAGTYYVVYKSGGASWGGNPIVLDNVTLVNATPSPVAGFTTVTSTSNLDAVFTNTSTDATSYSWDFGDGTGTSTDTSPTYTYAAEGPYMVSLTATSAVGSDQYSSLITVGNPTNYITNGTFDDGTGWTVVNHYEATNTLGSVTFSGGVVTIDETTSGPWKHMGIYTAVNLDPGTYQFDMHMIYTGIADVWGEVYIGATEPVQNADYSGDQQVIKAYNSWDCSSITTYDGMAVAGGCDDTTPGQFDIVSSGTYYILFRTGGATYGSTGIVIDDMTLYSASTLGVSDYKIEGLKLYPNPTNNAWNISTQDQVIKTIEVYNILGRQVLTVNPNALSTQVDASGLTAGIYMATIKTDLGSETRKLIKN